MTTVKVHGLRTYKNGDRKTENTRIAVSHIQRHNLYFSKCVTTSTLKKYETLARKIVEHKYLQ